MHPLYTYTQVAPRPSIAKYSLIQSYTNHLPIHAVPDGHLKHMSYHAQDLDRPCAFPVHSLLTGVSTPMCAAACAQTPGCLSASFLPGPGTCVLHASPHDPLLMPMGSGEAGWRYLGQHLEAP